MARDPGIAAVLSAVIPGLGQLYVGSYVQGMLMIAFGFLLGRAAITELYVLGSYGALAMYALLWAGSIWNAQSTAKNLNRKGASQSAQKVD